MTIEIIIRVFLMFIKILMNKIRGEIIVRSDVKIILIDFRSRFKIVTKIFVKLVNIFFVEFLFFFFFKFVYLLRFIFHANRSN